MLRTPALLATVLVAAATVAGCAPAPRPLPPRAATSPIAPRPVGAQDPAVMPSTSAAPPQSCDPAASLRPAGPLPGPGQMPAGTTMARIAQRGRLIAGVDQNTYLFGFRDPTSGDLTGFDIEIAHEIARAIFGDRDRIQFTTITSAQRIPAIQSGAVDIVVRTMTMTCERWEQVAFSTEYFTASQKVLVPRDSPAKKLDDLGGQKVCATAGSTSIRTVAAHPSRPVPVAVADWTDCLVLLQQGQVSAISTDDTILAGLAAQDPNTKIIGPALSGEPYGVAMAKSATDLVRFVNAVLDRLRADGTWRAIYQRQLAVLGSPPAPPAARYRD
jgi:polar amino acid transport system substrate-binding protein